MARITIPYAVADFAEMRERGFYYVDKTNYIPGLEDYNAPIFLRPRRFGKSLLISMLAHYYDRTKANRFEELFGGTWIGEHPTEEHNQYLVIRYDFSAMVMADDMGASSLMLQASQARSRTRMSPWLGAMSLSPTFSSSARMKRLPDSRRRLAWEKIALYFMERLLVRYRIIVKGRRRRHG